jgi:hypothetical protein
MYLQLAEGENNGNYTALAQGGVMDMYIFIPAGFLPEFDKDSYVRADYFAKYEPTTANNLLNLLAPYQTTTMNDGPIASAVSFLPGGAFASKGITFAKNLIKKRQEAVAAGTKKPIFGQGSVFQNLMGKNKGATVAPVEDPAAAAAEAAAAAAAASQQKDFGINVQGQVNGQQFGVNYDPNAQAQPSFFTKYKTPLIIGGVVLAAGGIYLATRKKKK